MKNDDKLIKDIVNYHDSPYKKVHFKIEDGQKDDLIFTKNDISLNDLFISYEEIKEITLSLSSRLYNPSVVAKGPLSFITNSWKKGTPLTASPMNLIYSLDMDIKTNSNIYYFEDYSLENVLNILNILDENKVKVIDQLDIREMLITYPERNDMQKYYNGIVI